MIRTAPVLPADHGRTGRTDHHALAAAMRDTDEWVRVAAYATRKAAHNIAYQIRSGVYPAYASRRYDAQAITTADGVHEVWGRYAGERTPR
ncbi:MULTISPECIES: hypothetical protein [unclassified Nocardiopsis]|uniref:hypothetical protein n=1 Tax=Nocardiopsis TaxID=2013 RepID=UPI00387AF01F